ncbi:protein CbiG, partial [Candidatus Nitrosopumilus salaria BD31]
MEKTTVLAITKNGIKIGQNLKKLFPDWNIFCPSKLSNDDNEIIWYSEPTSEKIVELFKNSNALICIFSLGAVIRLIAPHLKDKKTDPAVIVIDDKTNFVISVLSGHIGGANQLTQEIAEKLGSLPVITTAADVNNTIAVDLVGREFNWKIDDDSIVTKISAHMVNEEP